MIVLVMFLFSIELGLYFSCSEQSRKSLRAKPGVRVRNCYGKAEPFRTGGGEAANERFVVANRVVLGAPPQAPHLRISLIPQRN